MSFQVGDTVVHWSFGLGQIIGLEERAVAGEKQLYYEVRIQNFSVWVPADSRLASRLRSPASARAFKKLFAILGGPAGIMSGDRRERKLQLHTKMAGGGAKAICQVIRDLTTLEQEKSLNYDEKSILKQACTLLLAEWGYALKMPAAQAQADLYQMLKPPSVPLAV
jgi:CarD family transcriptional regulator, regulator of rRNA transcription